MHVIVMTWRIHFEPQIWKRVLFDKNHTSIGGCNMRDNKLSLKLTDYNPTNPASTCEV